MFLTRGQENVVAAVLVVAIAVLSAALFYVFLGSSISQVSGNATLTAPFSISAVVYSGGDLHVYLHSPYGSLSGLNQATIYVLHNGVVLSSPAVKGYGCTGNVCYVVAGPVFLDNGNYAVRVYLNDISYEREFQVVTHPQHLSCGTCESCNEVLREVFSTPISGTVVVSVSSDLSDSGSPCISLRGVSLPSGASVVLDLNGHSVVSNSSPYVLDLNSVRGLSVVNGRISTGDVPCSGAVLLYDSNVVFSNVTVSANCGEGSSALHLEGGAKAYFDLHGNPSYLCDSSYKAVIAPEGNVFCACDKNIYLSSPYPPEGIACSCATYSSEGSYCSGSNAGD